MCKKYIWCGDGLYKQMKHYTKVIPTQDDLREFFIIDAIIHEKWF